jgi:hypothetical protein
LGSLTVAVATKNQSLKSVEAISARHGEHLKSAVFAALPPVKSVTRPWKLRVLNTYKEAAWCLILSGFPSAARMHNRQDSPCEACGVLGPDVGHRFWACLVAIAVRRNIEGHNFCTRHTVPSAARLQCLAGLPHKATCQPVHNVPRQTNEMASSSLNESRGLVNTQNHCMAPVF